VLLLQRREPQSSSVAPSADSVASLMAAGYSYHIDSFHIKNTRVRETETRDQLL